jgi:hypothetical protein
MEEVTRPGSDIAFSLEFRKNRERTPDNRSDFEEAVITLAGDVWASDRGGDIRGTPIVTELIRERGRQQAAEDRVRPEHALTPRRA